MYAPGLTMHASWIRSAVGCRIGVTAES